MADSSLRFHTVHGGNVSVSDDGRTATRLQHFQDALVFSNRPVCVVEKIHIWIMQTTDSWPSYSALRFGFTSADPATRAVTGVPTAAAHSKDTWWAIRETNLHEDIKPSTGSHLVYWRTEQGDLHIELHDKHGGFTEIQRKRIGVGENIWAVLHLCGSTGQIIINDTKELPQQLETTESRSEETFRFSPTVHGEAVRVLKGGKILQRSYGLYEESLAFLDRPMVPGQELHFRVTQNICGKPGSMVFGLTTNDPNTIDISTLPTRTIPELTSAPGYMGKHLDIKYIDNISDVTFIHVVLEKDGCLYLRVNREDSVPLILGIDLSKSQWAFVDLYGMPTEITIVDDADLPNYQKPPDISVITDTLERVYKKAPPNGEPNNLWRLIYNLSPGDLEDLAAQIDTVHGNEIDLNLVQIVLGDPYFADNEQTVSRAKMCVQRKLMKALPRIEKSRREPKITSDHLPSTERSLSDMTEEEQLEYAVKMSMQCDETQEIQVSESNTEGTNDSLFNPFMTEEEQLAIALQMSQEITQVENTGKHMMSDQSEDEMTQKMRKLTVNILKTVAATALGFDATDGSAAPQLADPSSLVDEEHKSLLDYDAEDAVVLDSPELEDLEKKAADLDVHTELDVAERLFSGIVREGQTRNRNEKQKYEYIGFLGLARVLLEHSKHEHDMKALSIITKAYGLLNAAILRADDQSQHEVNDMLRTCEETFLARALGNSKNHKDFGVTCRSAKNAFENMRKHVSIQLAEINDKFGEEMSTESTPEVRQIERDRVVEVRQICTYITHEIKSLTTSLTDKAVGILGDPSCPFALLGLGSLARNEMTPYSDFEFAILLENQDEKNEGNKIYFRKLTYLMHMFTLGLRETIVPSLAVSCLNDFTSKDTDAEWYLDVFTPRGFAFDGAMPWACKVPTGREDSEYGPKFEFIGTAEDIVALQVDPRYPKSDHIFETLVASTYICGEPDLVIRYHELVEVMLKRNTTTQDETGKFFNFTVGQIRALQSIKEDVTRWTTRLSDLGNNGKLYDAKKEMYRLPSTITQGLAMFRSVHNADPWEAVDIMQSTQAISHETAHNLLVVVSISNEIRLRTYMANTRQQENFRVIQSLPSKDDATQMYHLKRGTLFRYYQTVQPLEDALSACICESDLGEHTVTELNSLLKDKVFYSMSPEILARIHFRCLDYHGALRSLMENECHIPQSIEMELFKGILYTDVCQYDKAKSILTGLLHSDPTSQDPNTCRQILNALGFLSQCTSDPVMATEYYRKAVDAVDAANIPDLARSQAILSVAYSKLGKYKEASDVINCALDSYQKIYSSKSCHTDLLFSKLYSAEILLDTGKFSDAIKVQKDAYRMACKLYGTDVVHPLLATVLSKLSKTYVRYGVYDQAYSCLSRALEIRTLYYSEYTTHIDLIHSHLDLAQIFTHLGNFGMSELHLKKAMCLQENLQLTDESTLENATTHMMVGGLHLSVWSLEIALIHFEKALEIFRLVYGEESKSQEIAQALSSVTAVWGRKRDYETALPMQNNVIDLYTTMYETANHPDVVSAKLQLATMLQESGRIEDSIQTCEEVIKIWQTIFRDDVCHPLKLAAYQTIANSYQLGGNLESAEKYYIMALRDAKVLYGNAAHPDIADLLDNIGICFKKQQRFQQAVVFHTTALQMREVVFQNDTTVRPILASYNNLGNVYETMGNEIKAFHYHGLLLENIEKKGTIFGNPEGALFLVNASRLYSARGNVGLCISLYEKALESLRMKIAEDTHPAICVLLNNLGNEYSEIGEANIAVRYYEEAMSAQSKVYKDRDTIDTANTMLNLGRQLLTTADAMRGMQLIMKGQSIKNNLMRSACLK